MDYLIENARAGTFPPVRALRPDAPPELAAIAERALRPEPSEQYQDADALTRELSAYLAGSGAAAYRSRGWKLVRGFLSSDLPRIHSGNRNWMVNLRDHLAASS